MTTTEREQGRTNHRTRELRGSLACPHCGSPVKIRSSRVVSPTYRDLNLACLNIECGATFGGSHTITHQISPSACPNDGVTLRRSAPRRRGAANDDAPARDSGPEVPPPAANENEVLATASG